MSKEHSAVTEPVKDKPRVRKRACRRFSVVLTRSFAADLLCMPRHAPATRQLYRGERP